MRRFALFSVWMVLSWACHPSLLCADEKLGPSDPIAAIDGDPIYMGELNLILTEKLKVRDLDRIGVEVQQATAILLVRQHLAMRSLRSQGGEVLDGMIRRDFENYAGELKRRGITLAAHAKSRMADETSLAADLAWRTAWGQYLKSKLTDANLRLFFEQRRSQYAGTRWKVSQIFLKMDVADAASMENAERSLTELADELRQSEDVAAAFADAARQHSDSGSAADGGLIGWVEKDGDLPGQAMTAVRNTEVGQITGPIRSPLGIHLIYVHANEPGRLTFETLTDQAQLRRDAANALFDALVEQQSGAKITWFVPALRPPADAKIIP